MKSFMKLEPTPTNLYRDPWQKWHLDYTLFLSLIILCAIGLTILYSAANKNMELVVKQIIRLGIAYAAMFVIAQIPPSKMRAWAIWLYGIGLTLVAAVLIMGQIGKGAQRWLDLGILTFQPSEIMKIAVPMTVAWYLNDGTLPPNLKKISISGLLILFPAAMIAKQPDLGTALMIVVSGAACLFLAGLSWKIITGLALLGGALTPIFWHFMYDYQRQRILTFLNPERDPLNKGYHIIQSKIAIGSGGFFGKGWLQGTQSQLDFLPEHTTDFIFAVCGEEFGFVGCFVLLAVYAFIITRCFFIAIRAQDTFTRLLAGSLGTTFFLSVFVNTGMVVGILPVVGIPLPLVSYGGTSMVTMFAMFGILMSIQTHRNLLTK